MGDDLDWGPRRPPAVGWAGSLLLLLGLGQAALVGAALAVDGAALLGGRVDRFATTAVLALFALQALAAVGVLRLWRWWRGIAVALSLVGLALQGASIVAAGGRVEVVATNGALAAGYLLVLVLLRRARDAFR